ncbi:GFA family protein [Bdellovibrio sp. 22V]|uniref:GFA family protein n=1 Tax=Bdellovibrio TaxID=958 RepID=UPI00254343DE|nr:GFA family protein [Bdellovibrio sp. 22V]WII72135.1 GFA family protein [Bdellovibrio sp. 22V]
MKYTGGCHCQAVRFEVEVSLDNVISCNCSICSKKGHWLAFAPAKDFRLLFGEDSLTDYQFGKKMIHHLFCKVCGIGAFGKGALPDGTEMRAINVRCLDGIDLDKIKVTAVDGKSF